MKKHLTNLYGCCIIVLTQEYKKGGEGALTWHFNQREPVFIQIVRQIRAEILNGKYAADEQIPPVRQLAYEASVNPNTMQRALSKLEEEGLLYTRGTVGRFVTSDTAVLEAARETMRRDFVRTWLYEAETLGITGAELIQYINKEDDRK